MIRDKTDTLVLTATFIFVFLVGITKFSDYDIFYHLATGGYVLETGKINLPVDPFAFTPTNLMSVSSWLSGVMFFKVHEFSGIGGLIVFKAVIITLAFFFLYLNIRILTDGNRWSRYVVFLFLLAALFAVRMRMSVRPHIFEFLLLPVFFYILNLYRLKNKNYLFILPLLQMLWVNVHPSNIIGMVIPLAYLAGEGLKRLLGRKVSLDGKRLSFLALISFFVILSSVINPRGYEVFIYPFMLTGQELYMANIAEWDPLRLAHLTGYNLRYTWGFSFILLSAVFVFLYQRKKVDLTELIVFCLFFYQALMGVRLTSEFALAVAPIAARGWSSILSRFDLGRLNGRKYIIDFGLVLALSVVFYASVVNSKTYAFGLGLKHRVFPVKAVDFLIANGIRGNMYNSIGYGGYLIWRLYPSHRVFIDGRNDVYSEALYREYLDAHSRPDVWNKVVEEYDIDWVILEYSRDYARKERMPHLVDNPEWALVYWDREAIVYARRGSKNDDIIKRYEYRYTRPNELNPTYMNRYLFSTDIKADEVIGEFKRSLSLNQDNEEAHIGLAYIYYQLGRHDEEIKEMEKVVEIDPGLGFAHSSLGELYMQIGEVKKAVDEFEKALKIDPEDKVAQSGLERLKRTHLKE
jgi:tetratricopeptide (TPR) repeat protein